MVWKPQPTSSPDIINYHSQSMFSIFASFFMFDALGYIINFDFNLLTNNGNLIT